MTSYVTPKKGAEYIFYIGLVSQSTGQFQANPTLAAGDFKVSIDGGAFNNLATLPAVTPASGRAVKVTLSTSEMNGDNIVVQGVDAAGAEWDEVFINIQTSARQIDDLAYPTTSGRSIDVTAGGEVGIDWANIGSPTTTVNLSGTTVKTATDVETDTADIQSRLPAALVSGRMDSSVGAMAANTITATAIATNAIDADALAADAVTEIQSGLATSAALATVQADTDNIQTRLPAALSGDGFMKADLLSIGDELVSGNNAILKLKSLDIQSSDSNALLVRSTAPNKDAALFESNGNFCAGVYVQANGDGGAAFYIDGQGSSTQGLFASSLSDHAAEFSSGSGKSINAPQDIALPSGDLDDQLQAIDNAVDTEVAAIKAKTDQLTFTTANQVDANIQSVNDTALTGDGSSGNPWGPA